MPLTITSRAPRDAGDVVVEVARVAHHHEVDPGADRELEREQPLVEVERRCRKQQVFRVGGFAPCVPRPGKCFAVAATPALWIP